jgi:hypothetical protein
MSFWIRHIFLLLSCVFGPFLAALYVDTLSEIRRADKGAGVAARLAAQSLSARLTLDAHKTVNEAILVAQHLADHDLVGEIARGGGVRREASFKAIVDELSKGAPKGGFAWLIDDSGAIVARSGLTQPEEQIHRIGGHPLFIETQDGYALDGLWKEGGKVSIVGAAPIVVRGQSQGAIFVGRPLDRATLEPLAFSLRTQVTVLSGDDVIASTLDGDLASQVAKAARKASEPVSAGALREPLSHPFLPFVPFFVAHDAQGLAYSSLEAQTPGRDVSWVVSVEMGEMLRELPKRQELIISGAAIFMMLALLMGLVNHRTFVSPVNRITDHLSELHLGRGELELPETSVSAAFRRLVKLINMTVQKIPSRSLVRSMSPDPSPISEIGQTSPLPREPSSTPIRTGDIKSDDLMLGLAPPTTAELAKLRSPALPDPPTDGNQGASISKEFQPEDAVLAAAAAAYSSQRPSSQAKGKPPKIDDEAAAIAEAIASLEVSNTSPPPAPSARPRAASSPRSIPTHPPEATRPPVGASKPKSAADIRGKPSQSMSMASPFMPSASEMFRAPIHGAPSFTPRQDEQMSPADIARMNAFATATPVPGDPTSPRAGGSLDLGAPAGMGSSEVFETGFNPEATVVAPVQDELLRKTTREESTGSYRVQGSMGAAVPEMSESGDMTAVAQVPQELLQQTMVGDDQAGDDLSGLDAADHAHFKETYERFIEMRKRCGEATGDLAFDRFLQKLTKNREGLIKKYNCRTVRFQVYEKDGKAALKATPVRAR